MAVLRHLSNIKWRLLYRCKTFHFFNSHRMFCWNRMAHRINGGKCQFRRVQKERYSSNKLINCLQEMWTKRKAAGTGDCLIRSLKLKVVTGIEIFINRNDWMGLVRTIIRVDLQIQKRFIRINKPTGFHSATSCKYAKNQCHSCTTRRRNTIILFDRNFINSN